MNQLFKLFALILVVVACKGEKGQIAMERNEGEWKAVERGDVGFPVYDFEGLKPLLSKKDGKTYIINFWATWCKPCVKELPAFERLYDELGNDNVELILVSLDMKSMWKTKLEPFVAEHQLRGTVVILDDPNMNEWIPKIDPDWNGGIPATLIYNQNNRQFYEGGFTYEQLKKEVNQFLEP